MYPALKVKEYLYLIKNKRHKTETCFNLAMIGREMHVKIGQKLPNSTEEPYIVAYSSYMLMEIRSP